MSSTPRRITRRGEACGQIFGIPTAAMRSEIESGRIRTPVSMAESASTTERKSGTTKKTPACSRNWNRNMISPPLSCRTERISGRISGSRPTAIWWFSHRKKIQTTRRPATTSQNVMEMPSRSGAPALGWMSPHSLSFSTPKTAMPRPSTESRVPTRSSRG